jgi:PAS domain S-box-containing protein
LSTEGNRQSPSPDGNIQHEYYRYLCNCSSFAVVGADCQGIIVSCNRAAEMLFNTTSSQMLGRHIELIVPEAQRQTLNNAIERVLTQRQVSEFEANHRDEHGESMTLSVEIVPVLDNQDQLIGTAAWARDITRRKSLQRQLVQAEKMASLGTLASGVAHHFNNIIAGVATYVDYALHSNNREAANRALQMTAEAAGRISQITFSLLTFAEKDMRQFDLSDLTEVILTFAHLMQKPLSEKNISLELHLQAVPIYEVPTSQLLQALGNLIDNAQNALPDGGTVTIDLHTDNDNLVLCVSDTGHGIAPKDLPRIFEPFFTTRGTFAGGDHPSHGLGLAVVHGIVGELGGTINVKSQPSHGTTFTIRLPPQK